MLAEYYTTVLNALEEITNYTINESKVVIYIFGKKDFRNLPSLRRVDRIHSIEYKLKLGNFPQHKSIFHLGKTPIQSWSPGCLQEYSGRSKHTNPSHIASLFV